MSTEMQLNLDRIIASQSELGPTPPDGGYGWIVLCTCVYIQLTIPSLLASYGTFLLFDQIENLEHDNEYLIWDHEMTLVPIIFMSFWTLSECWCYTIVNQFKWPKTIIFCGICLICGSNLIVYAAELNEPTIILYYYIAGALTGIGTSLIIQQCEYLIRQYFKNKYKVAKNILYLSNIIGFILTPLLMGNLIVRHGVLESILGYQTILATVFIAGLLFKQPILLTPTENVAYNLLSSTSSSEHDENLVFNKVGVDEVIVQPSTSESNRTKIEQTFSADLNRNFDTNPVNTEYSYETNKPSVNWLQKTNALFHAGIFYKFLLLILVEKISILLFWTLYPSVIYDEIDSLNVHTTIMCVTFVAIGGLAFTVFWNCFQIRRTTVKILLALSLFLASLGFTVIYCAVGKNWLIFGGILSTASLSSVHVLTETFILQNTDGISDHARKIVNFIVGITIFLTSFLNIEYNECFEAVSLLQFIVGSIWLSNMIYKKIKKIFA